MTITTSDWHEDHYSWGDMPSFHSLNVNGNEFAINDRIQIQLVDGSIIEGIICFIQDYFLDLLSHDGQSHRVMFQNMQSIC